MEAWSGAALPRALHTCVHTCMHTCLSSGPLGRGLWALRLPTPRGSPASAQWLLGHRTHAETPSGWPVVGRLCSALLALLTCQALPTTLSTHQGLGAPLEKACFLQCPPSG